MPLRLSRLIPISILLTTSSIAVEHLAPSITNLGSTSDVCTEVNEEDNDAFLVPCNSLDSRWIVCSEVRELPSSKVNSSIIHDEGAIRKDSLNTCAYLGTSKGPQLHVNVTCAVLPCIECKGARSFSREQLCVKYTGHYFITALLYSTFLGFLAVDRFYLGYSAIAIAKLMTLGGFGLWWMADILLLLGGYLLPADDSSWQPWELWSNRELA